MKDNRRILFVTDTLGYGGAEKQLAFVAEGLVQRDWQVVILNLNQRGEKESREVDKRIKVIVADIAYRNSLFSNYEFVRQTADTVKRFSPSVIVGFKELANFCVTVVGKLSGVPSVISERADPFTAYANKRLPVRIKLWCINSASGGVFQTKRASEFYGKSLQRNGIIIPNPVFIKDKNVSLDYENLPKSVISLGRLDNYQKRYDIMLQAFVKFHKLYPEYDLRIFGDGKDVDSIKQWIVDLGLDSCVKLMGASKQPLKDLCKSGIFLITSDFEGISNSLLEAMACGLPVVATDHSPGGARLLIKNKENGLLVPVRDVDAICNALSCYAEDLSLRIKCGNNAKRVVHDYSPERILDLWENYMIKMITKR